MLSFNKSINMFLVMIKGTEPFEGFLILALPVDDPTAPAVGSFGVTVTGENSTALSQSHCTGVSILSAKVAVQV